jgi:hypothetical protein
MNKALHNIPPFLVAGVMILFGLFISSVAYSIIGQWHSVSPAYAACAVAWIVAGPAMFVAGWWVLGSGGRQRIPLQVGGLAAVVAGVALVAGVLAHVVPCSGPS